MKTISHQVPVFKYKQSHNCDPSATLKSPKLCPDGSKHVGVPTPAAETCSTFTAYGQGLNGVLLPVVFVLLLGYVFAIFVYKYPWKVV